MKTIKMNLSTNGIKHIIKRLERLKKNFDIADKELVKELAEFGIKEIEKNYASTPFKDGNDDVSFYITGTEKEKSVGVTGSQVLYNEFGTGTEGQNNPHPQKGDFGLNGYNTGSKIKENTRNNSNASALGIPQGGLYWIYNNNGVAVYTQGIPAGKQVYNAKNALQKRKKEISKKVVGDALSKL